MPHYKVISVYIEIFLSWWTEFLPGTGVGAWVVSCVVGSGVGAWVGSGVGAGVGATVGSGSTMDAGSVLGDRRCTQTSNIW